MTIFNKKFREFSSEISPDYEDKMFHFLQIISSTQLAIKLQIGVCSEYKSNRLIEKSDFSKFLQQFSHKIKALRIDCFVANFEKFYNEYEAIMENLLSLSTEFVRDKVIRIEK